MFKRLFSAFLAALICCSVLAGCSQKQQLSPEDQALLDKSVAVLQARTKSLQEKNAKLAADLKTAKAAAEKPNATLAEKQKALELQKEQLATLTDLKTTQAEVKQTEKKLSSSKTSTAKTTKTTKTTTTDTGTAAQTPPPSTTPQTTTQTPTTTTPTTQTPTTTAKPIKIEMVWIKPGIFTMGSPEGEPGYSVSSNYNEPRRQVTLTKGFYMGKTEVTQAQYQAVMGENPSAYHSANWYSHDVTGLNTGNFPIDMVTWYDAIEFCNALSVKEGLSPYYTIDKTTEDPDNWNGYSLNKRKERIYDPANDDDTLKWLVTVNPSANGYRLPTEAQWEYACRAGTTTGYNWGTNYIDYKKANYKTDYESNTSSATDLKRPTEVGSYAPNNWGLYDMHGNLSEWCWDWGFILTYSNDTSPRTDPLGDSNGRTRMLRGGGWDYGYGQLRSGYRHGLSPMRKANDVGFRVIRP